MLFEFGKNQDAERGKGHKGKTEKEGKYCFMKSQVKNLVRGQLTHETMRLLNGTTFEHFDWGQGIDEQTIKIKDLFTGNCFYHFWCP